MKMGVISDYTHVRFEQILILFVRISVTLNLRKLYTGYKAKLPIETEAKLSGKKS